jgi:succinyl-diaminopimelate desuccinylase
VDSIVDLARVLIAIPSQGGIDAPDRVVDALGQWLAGHRLDPAVLPGSDGRPVGLTVDIGTGDAPRYCLDACLDTAPFGDRSAWSFPPTAPAIYNGWLGGRGAADCKTAAAIFAHLGAELAAGGGFGPGGTVSLLFDADEHTGHFGGVHAYTATAPRPDGVMIGYPGRTEIMVGARGFWRATVAVHGRSAHSGSRTATVDNALVRAAALVQLLAGLELPAATDDAFPLGPKVTVTALHGGEGFSVVPDRCTVAVDVRLTPACDAAWAAQLVDDVCRRLDDDCPGARPTVVEAGATWPADRLPASSPLAAALQAGVREALGRTVPLAVAGPSNIANYLATLGIDATCGFGVAHRNLHAADEAIEIASIAPVYGAYRAALGRLLAG